MNYTYADLNIRQYFLSGTSVLVLNCTAEFN